MMQLFENKNMRFFKKYFVKVGEGFDLKKTNQSLSTLKPKPNTMQPQLDKAIPADSN